MTDNIVRLPIPPKAQIEKWRSEASMHELPDECDAHIARRAAAWGAAAGICAALQDTAHCHWRVADGDQDGTQLVRAKDLMVWAETVYQQAVYNDVESDND